MLPNLDRDHYATLFSAKSDKHPDYHGVFRDSRSMKGTGKTALTLILRVGAQSDASKKGSAIKYLSVEACDASRSLQGKTLPFPVVELC